MVDVYSGMLELNHQNYLANGEVVMATGWNGRFFNAQMEGTPLVQVWDGQILDYEYFALVKDGPGYADGSAMKVLREMTSTEMLAGRR